MPAHSLSANLLPHTTVAMESGSEGNRLCQPLTKMLARGRLGLFSESYFHAPYLQILNLGSPSGIRGKNDDSCVELRGVSAYTGRGGY